MPLLWPEIRDKAIAFSREWQDAESERAFVHALDYFPGIADRDLPRYVLASDFARFRLYDIEASTHAEFALKDLHKHIKRFGC